MAPQVVVEAAALSIQGCAQDGIWAAAKLAIAKIPKAEYCILYNLCDLRIALNE